jgi:NADH-quinone oxidoreductase subunit L
MVTHAFFKALLFLGSGSVIHGLHGQQDMRKMGGLRKWMPITAVTFIIGWLAIAGIPPFAGFWSKDDILLAAWAHGGSGIWKVLWFTGFVTALLTAFYMSRQVFMVFFGEPRFETEGEHAVHPHESPWTMALPLVVLAGLSIGGGALNLPFTNSTKFLDKWLTPVVEASQRPFDIAGAVQTSLAVGTGVLCAVAIVVAAQIYLRHKREPIEPPVLAHAYYYDEAVSRFVAGPGQLAFEETARFDRGIVDGAVNGVAALVRWGASKLRLAQTGYVRNYAVGIAVGAFVLVGLFLTRAGG